jgi:glycosyltransferase involved in cell wall biosynthesis
MNFLKNGSEHDSPTNGDRGQFRAALRAIKNQYVLLSKRNQELTVHLRENKEIIDRLRRKINILEDDQWKLSQELYQQIQNNGMARHDQALYRTLMNEVSIRRIHAYWSIKRRIIYILFKPWYLLKSSLLICRNDGILSFFNRLKLWLQGERSFALRSHESAVIPEDTRQKALQERYRMWIEQNEPGAQTLQTQRVTSRQWNNRPFFSILMPVFNTPVPVLEEAIESIVAQSYENFELCIVNAGTDPGTAGVLSRLSIRDDRIKVRNSVNKGISENTNLALSGAKGDFIVLMDHDDTLAPFALFAVAEAIRSNPRAQIFYSDEDKLSETGERVFPFFKPEFSPELLHSFMYIGHLTIYRKDLIDSLGGFRAQFDGSQDYDLILRASEITADIHHIPQILYHWRMLPVSAASNSGAKSYARKTNLAALADAMLRRGFKGEVKEYPFSNRFKFKIKDETLVSIIVPSDDLELIKECLAGIFRGTSYKNYEIIVVTNSSIVQQVSEDVSDQRVRFVQFNQPFNFSAKCNVGAQEAKGEYIVFFNDDMFPITRDWIQSMLEYAQQPEIGGVSPKLIYENDTIQYAGMVTGVRDMIGTAFHMQGRNDGFYQNMALSTRNVSLLTGACLMINRLFFWEIGGWDSIHAPIANSDIELSFRILEAGRRLVYTPFAELRHIGHKSIGKIDGGRRKDDLSHLYVLHRWGERLSNDPFYTAEMRKILYAAPPSVQISASSHLNGIVPSETVRVILVSHDMTLSGAPLMLFRFAKYLKSIGWFITVLSPKDGNLRAHYKDADIPVIIDPVALENPHEILHLFEPYDLIVLNTVHAWYGVHVAKRIAKPSLWLIHEPEFGADYVRGLDGIQTSFTIADALVYPSGETAQLYESFHRDNPNLILRVGIDDPTKLSLPLELLPEKSKKVRIVHVGTVEFRKGADILLEALQILPDEILQNLEVVFIGKLQEPSFVERVRRMAAAFPHTVFLGEIPHESLLACVKSADIFACTSREETGPLVVFEAMALSKAIISTKVGAAAEAIINGENGFLVERGDSKAIAESITILFEDIFLRANLGREARKAFERFFTIEHYHKKLKNICTALVGAQSILDAVGSQNGLYWSGAKSAVSLDAEFSKIDSLLSGLGEENGDFSDETAQVVGIRN